MLAYITGPDRKQHCSVSHGATMKESTAAAPVGAAVPGSLRVLGWSVGLWTRE